jgi:tRNA-2-methylthio-N6-dimethylallyladenosine synthase
VAEINARYLGRVVDVLFEEKVKGRWKGRTPTNKLVFVETDEDPSTGSPFGDFAGQSLKGRIVPVSIIWTGPWSMQANLLRQAVPINLYP